MYTAEYVTRERGAPAVLAVAVNFALLYLLAAGLGVMPAPPLSTTTTLFDVPEDTVKPLPVRTQPMNPQSLDHSFERINLPSKPNFEIEPDSVLPPTVGEPIIDIGSGDPPPGDMSMTTARVLKSPEPPYPSISRLSGEEGIVYVKVNISPYGLVGDAQIERSSGFARLDEAALKAIRAWRFAPATRGTQAIATWVVVPVKFVLNGRG